MGFYHWYSKRPDDSRDWAQTVQSDGWEVEMDRGGKADTKRFLPSKSQTSAKNASGSRRATLPKQRSKAKQAAATANRADDDATPTSPPPSSSIGADSAEDKPIPADYAEHDGPVDMTSVSRPVGSRGAFRDGR